MLRHLSIFNYAIIDQLEIDFQKGFTVITGETGAGKSILLGALSLILGQRADKSVLNDKDRKCIVEGEFTFELQKFSQFFKTYELDYEEVTIIRREINSKGKSRAFINDTPVTLNVLRELTSELIDIHSQHETLNLQNNKIQLNVVDAFAGNEEQLFHYTLEYNKYIKLQKELSSLKDRASQSKLDIDYISFQAQEIERLNLKPNEKEGIESELELINNAEAIKYTLENSAHVLSQSDNNLLLELKRLSDLFNKISSCSESYKSINDRLSSVIIELEDLTQEVLRENDTISFNPENALYLNERLSSIYSIEQKHNVSSTEEILSLLNELNAKLEVTNSYDSAINELSLAVKNKEKELLLKAQSISKNRLSCFERLCDKISEDLAQLGMKDALFRIEHEQLAELNEHGFDVVRFLFSANKGMPVIDLKRAASGGELSRLMLVIKSILAKDRLSSIIFDEIDTGVSGEIADKMARIMKRMGSNMQVISITHLPQVAAKAACHFKIYKENFSDKAKTQLIILKGDERVEELAKMLSGEKISEAAMENAKSLLNV